MNELLIVYLGTCVLNLIFFTVGFVTYPRYIFSFWKLIIVSIFPIGFIGALIAGICTSMYSHEDHIGAKLTNWLYVDKPDRDIW